MEDQLTASELPALLLGFADSLLRAAFEWLARPGAMTERVSIVSTLLAVDLGGRAMNLRSRGVLHRHAQVINAILGTVRYVLALLAAAPFRLAGRSAPAFVQRQLDRPVLPRGEEAHLRAQLAGVVDENVRLKVLADLAEQRKEGGRRRLETQEIHAVALAAARAARREEGKPDSTVPPQVAALLDTTEASIKAQRADLEKQEAAIREARKLYLADAPVDQIVAAVEAATPEPAPEAPPESTPAAPAEGA